MAASALPRLLLHPLPYRRYQTRSTRSSRSASGTSVEPFQHENLGGVIVVVRGDVHDEIDRAQFSCRPPWCRTHGCHELGGGQGPQISHEPLVCGLELRENARPSLRCGRLPVANSAPRRRSTDVQPDAPRPHLSSRPCAKRSPRWCAARGAAATRRAPRSRPPGRAARPSPPSCLSDKCDPRVRSASHTRPWSTSAGGPFRTRLTVPSAD